MTATTAYTEGTLAQFMSDALGPTGAALGLNVPTVPLVTQAVTAVVRLVGSEIAAATDMALLEAAARWQAWEAALSAATNGTHVKAGTAEVWASERFDHITARLAVARSAWFRELSRSETAASGSGFFGFATVSGCRGR